MARTLRTSAKDATGTRSVTLGTISKRWRYYATERALVYGLGRAGDLELHVISGPGPDASAQHHFALEVDGLDAARGRLADAGYAIEETRPVGGRERFFVRDPFGNLIEFVTPPG